MTFRFPGPDSPAGRALAEWRARYASSPPFPYALDLPPRPYPEARDYDAPQQFCTDLPGGCPICDRKP